MAMDEEKRKVMVERYADCGNEELARELGVSVRTVGRWAKALGLRKSEKRLAEIRLDAQRTVEWMRLCGKRVGGVKKGQGKANAGSFKKGHRFSGEAEERRVRALRERGMDERRRIRNGEERKTRWRMDEKTWRGR